MADRIRTPRYHPALCTRPPATVRRGRAPVVPRHARRRERVANLILEYLSRLNGQLQQLAVIPGEKYRELGKCLELLPALCGPGLAAATAACTAGSSSSRSR